MAAVTPAAASRTVTTGRSTAAPPCGRETYGTSIPSPFACTRTASGRMALWSAQAAPQRPQGTATMGQSSVRCRHGTTDRRNGAVLVSERQKLMFNLAIYGAEPVRPRPVPLNVTISPGLRSQILALLDNSEPLGAYRS